jgi:hypothetical protein
MIFVSSTAVDRSKQPVGPLASVDNEDEQFIVEVGQSLRTMFSELSHASNAPLRQILGDPVSIVETFMSSLPKLSAWSERLGPMYTGSSLAQVLGVSRQTISERASKRTLIALRTVDDHMLYPRFQFDKRLRPIQGLSDIWRILTGVESDEWTCASWLVAPLPRLKGKSAVAFLGSGGDLEGALSEAKAVAARWSK